MPKKVATAKPKATPKKKAKELKQDGNNIYSRAYHKAKREGSGKEEAGLFFKKQPWQSDFHAANHIKSVFLLVPNVSQAKRLGREACRKALEIA